MEKLVAIIEAPWVSAGIVKIRPSIAIVATKVDLFQRAEK
jgi:hypothetical protein